MKKLVDGIIEFRKKKIEQYREDYAHLALGQSPDTLFIACSDSRVVPNLFASTNPGDLFVVRNVGNLIPIFTTVEPDMGSSEAAAIEFAMSSFPIHDIIVCGHSECGAMNALISGVQGEEKAHLREWLHNCQATLENNPLRGEFFENLSLKNQFAQVSVLQQIEHLKTYPLIAEKLEKNAVRLHGWYFDIATGDVYAYEEEEHQFVLIDEVEAPRILQRKLQKKTSSSCHCCCREKEAEVCSR